MPSGTDVDVRRSSTTNNPFGDDIQCLAIPRKEGQQQSLAARLNRTSLFGFRQTGLDGQKEKPQKKPPTRRDYETVGYVLSGQAELRVEGQTVTLEPGDSWLVPAGVEHSYRILSEFSAIEATSPPAQVHGRDE